MRRLSGSYAAIELGGRCFHDVAEQKFCSVWASIVMLLAHCAENCRRRQQSRACGPAAVLVPASA